MMHCKFLIISQALKWCHLRNNEFILSEFTVKSLLFSTVSINGITLQILYHLLAHWLVCLYTSIWKCCDAWVAGIRSQWVHIPCISQGAMPVERHGSDISTDIAGSIQWNNDLLTSQCNYQYDHYFWQFLAFEHCHYTCPFYTCL